MNVDAKKNNLFALFFGRGRYFLCDCLPGKQLG